jgi:hypothetical protein
LRLENQRPGLSIWQGFDHRGGGFVVTDGTFAETKEVIGGYYVIEAADLDEALAIAKQVPSPMGGVEVRPIIN